MKIRAENSIPVRDFSVGDSKAENQVRNLSQHTYYTEKLRTLRYSKPLGIFLCTDKKKKTSCVSFVSCSKGAVYKISTGGNGFSWKRNEYLDFLQNQYKHFRPQFVYQSVFFIYIRIYCPMLRFLPGYTRGTILADEEPHATALFTILLSPGTTLLVKFLL